MAKRLYRRTYRVPSDEVQGEGSFVEFTNLTWTEAREFFGQRQSDNESLAARVVAWNWVDENDEPLPLPKDDMTVLDRLVAQETAFIIRWANKGMGDDDTKN